jgi:hypothetical protein
MSNRRDTPEGTFKWQGRDDQGRLVEVNSTGGCFVSEPGVVVCGPFAFPDWKLVRPPGMPRPGPHPWSRPSAKALKRYTRVDFVSGPWWVVRLDRWGRQWTFCETELSFA